MSDARVAIESHILNVVRAKKSQWLQMQSQQNQALSLDKGYNAVHDRFSTIRADIVNALNFNDRNTRLALGIKDNESFHASGFVFDAEVGGVFQNSQPDAVGITCEYAGVNERTAFFDIGTGFGEAAFVAALFGSQVTTIEINPYFFEIAAILREVFSDFRGVASVVIKLGDYREADLTGYDFCKAYLPPELMGEFLTSYTPQAKPGSILITSTSKSGQMPSPEFWERQPWFFGYKRK